MRSRGCHGNNCLRSRGTEWDLIRAGADETVIELCNKIDSVASTLKGMLQSGGPQLSSLLQGLTSFQLQGCDSSLHRHFTNLDGRWVQLQLHKVVNYGMANELLYKLQQQGGGVPWKEKAGICMT